MATKYDYSKHEDLNWNFDLKEHISDLNTYFKIIGIPEYIERPDTFYIEKNVLVEELFFLLHKTPLERFKKYLLFAGWEYLQNPKNENSDINIQKINNAKLLLFLRQSENQKANINISLYANQKTKHITKDEEIIHLIRNYLENQVFETFINDFRITIGKKISNERLINYIKKGHNSKGAPIKNSRVAQFAELLIFLIHSRKEIGYKVEKFSNQDCNLIHDYLVLMKILKSKRKNILEVTDTEYKSYSTPHNYIRSLINNLRNQRVKQNVKLQF